MTQKKRFLFCRRIPIIVLEREFKILFDHIFVSAGLWRQRRRNKIARPRKYDSDDVIEAACQLFWRYGYERVSIDDLEGATGLKRGSLYNAFGDKRGIYLAALDHYAREEIRTVITDMRRSGSFERAVKTLFARGAAQAGPQGDRRGCMLCDAAVEEAPRDLGVARRVQKAFAPLQDEIALMIKTEHGLTKTEANDHAQLLLAAYMGARVMAKAGYSLSILRNIGAHASLLNTEAFTE